MPRGPADLMSSPLVSSLLFTVFIRSYSSKQGLIPSACFRIIEWIKRSLVCVTSRLVCTRYIPMARGASWWYGVDAIVGVIHHAVRQRVAVHVFMVVCCSVESIGIFHLIESSELSVWPGFVCLLSVMDCLNVVNMLCSLSVRSVVLLYSCKINLFRILVSAAFCDSFKRRWAGCKISQLWTQPASTPTGSIQGAALLTSTNRTPNSATMPSDR